MSDLSFHHSLSLAYVSVGCCKDIAPTVFFFSFLINDPKVSDEQQLCVDDLGDATCPIFQDQNAFRNLQKGACDFVIVLRRKITGV